MSLDRLPFDAPVESYEEQAARLLRAHSTGEPWAIKLIHENHPRFLDDKVRWLPKRIGDAEIQSADFRSHLQMDLTVWHDRRLKI